MAHDLGACNCEAYPSLRSLKRTMQMFSRSRLLVFSLLAMAGGCDRLAPREPTYCGPGFYVTGEHVTVLAEEQQADFDVTRLAYNEVVWVAYSGNGVRPPRYLNAARVGEWVSKPEIGGLFARTGFDFPAYVELRPSQGSAAQPGDLNELSKAVRARSTAYDPCVAPEVVTHAGRADDGS